MKIPSLHMFKFNSAKYLIIVGILMDLWWTVNET